MELYDTPAIHTEIKHIPTPAADIVLAFRTRKILPDITSTVWPGEIKQATLSRWLLGNNWVAEITRGNGSVRMSVPYAYDNGLSAQEIADDIDWYNQCVLNAAMSQAASRRENI